MIIHSLLHTSEPVAPDAGPGMEPQVTFTKPPLDVGEPADCCCAAAQVRVVLPPVAGPATPTELHLCAHHYRKAAAALATAGADVYDAHGHWLSGHAPYWADLKSARTLDLLPA